jgi:hypothetical protein
VAGVFEIFDQVFKAGIAVEVAGEEEGGFDLLFFQYFEYVAAAFAEGIGGEYQRQLLTSCVSADGAALYAGVVGAEVVVYMGARSLFRVWLAGQE